MRKNKQPGIREYLQSIPTTQKVILSLLSLYIVGRIGYFLYKWI